MSVVDRLLEHNRTHASQLATPDLPARPRLGLAVVACMDARVDVAAVFGLAPGDAHVIRNAGGIVTDDVLRSLLISQRLLGTTEVALLHHSDCGMTTFRDEDLAARVAEEVGQPLPFSLGAFADLEESVRHSIARLRECPFLPHRERIRGFVYEVETGRLREVTGKPGTAPRE